MIANYNDYYAVIMAGGGGTRLWPLSRQSKPKQMLDIIGEKTLFQISVDRLGGLFPPERIYVVTIQEQIFQLQKLCPQIPSKNYVIEPFPRGTAAVVGLAAVVLNQIDPDAVMAILTADHFIENEAKFQQILKSAYHVCQDGSLVTLGINPTFAATGYGYIQRGEYLDDYIGFTAFKAKRFKEKPKPKEAEEYLKKGDHDWNSGMFVWKISSIMEEFKYQMPALNELLTQISHSMQKPGWEDQLILFWEKVIPQTIDYGIMENAAEVAVIPAVNLGWNDVGSWDSLFDVLASDKSGNILLNITGEKMNTSNTLVYSENPEKLIVTIGLEDMIIIDTKDALLVCKRENAQDVREIVYRLKLERKEKYL